MDYIVTKKTMNKQFLLPLRIFTLISTSLLCSNYAFAHAEHDKARYVAPTGIDEGKCETVSKPCKTIGYAASHANKGDMVLVAEGQYIVSDVDDLFYLTSKLVPVYGGFNQQNHYKKAEPEKYPTYILGAPTEFRDKLSERGFRVVSDSKVVGQIDQELLQNRLRKVEALSQAKANVDCVDGDAGDHPCYNMDLVAHVPLENMSLNPTAANDIWGHVDLNTGKEYAIIGVRNGSVFFDISDPENPVEVGAVPGLRATWRDIKVYQFFDETAQRWRAYAYVSTDGNADGIAIVDMSDLPNEIKLVDKDMSDQSLHNIYISNVNYTTGVPINGRSPRLHSMGSNRNGGAHRSYSLENPEQLSELYTATGKVRADYTHDGTSFVVEDDRVQSQCKRIGEECDIFVDFNESEVRIWDQTDGSTITELGQGKYEQAAYTHSGWWSEDKNYVFVHDELDETNYGINTTVHIFDVTDLTNPVKVGSWRGGTTAIDHNGFVRGNRYYMSNYEKGVTVLDITNPAEPNEVGFFDTFPFADSASFNGAWGVYPYLPSGLILVSDINSGLYIVRDNTKVSTSGSLQFTQNEFSATEGEAVTITIERINGSEGVVSVDYQTLMGSASDADYVAAKGTLAWADGDTEPQTIEIQIESDELDEFQEKFSIELFNIVGGATLANNATTWVQIDGKLSPSSIRVSTDKTNLYEFGSIAANSISTISFNKLTASQESTTINFAVDESSTATENSDYTLSATSLSWAANETGEKSITINTINDEEAEDAETLVIVPTIVGSEFEFPVQTLTILDDESNAVPVIVVTNESIEQFTGMGLALSDYVTVTDDDTDLTIEWTVTVGNPFVSAPDSLDTLINSSAVGTAELVLTVTDPFGQTATETLTVTFKEPLAEDVPDSDQSKAFGINYGLIIGLLLLAINRRKWLNIKQS